MVAVPKQAIRVEQEIETEHPLVQLGLLCAAGFFISVLFLTYGIDLSPGLF
jgi:hypothetical protein